MSFLFVCLFGVLHSNRKLFTHMETSPLPVKGFKFWQMICTHSSEGTLACHNYCDTGHPFIRVISEDSWYSHLLQSVWQWSYRYLFLRLRSVATGIRTSNLPLARRTKKGLAKNSKYTFWWIKMKKPLACIFQHNIWHDMEWILVLCWQRQYQLKRIPRIYPFLYYIIIQ